MRVSKYLTALAAGGCLAFFASLASAATVDLSGLANANLDTYYNGSVYPVNGGPITIGGINFNLVALNNGTGVLQTNPTTASFDIPVGEYGITSVYTIINSAFGQMPYEVGDLVFTGSDGATFTYDLTEGDNIRDHATTQYNTIAPNVFATMDFGDGDRLDVQQIILPADFATQTLVSITFEGTDPDHGQPFLAAVTTNTSIVPEPASWLMMLCGFGGLALLVRSRRRRPVQAG